MYFRELFFLELFSLRKYSTKNGTKMQELADDVQRMTNIEIEGTSR
jgi:hypothetical protein